MILIITISHFSSYPGGGHRLQEGIHGGLRHKLHIPVQEEGEFPGQDLQHFWSSICQAHVHFVAVHIHFHVPRHSLLLLLQV